MTGDIRANIILRNTDLYETDKVFRRIVDDTIFLTPEEKEASQLEVDLLYGT